MIYILANAFTALTGGDRHFIEIARRWKRIGGTNIILVAPKSAQEVCRREGLYTDCQIVPPVDTKRFGIVLTYILRTIYALFRITYFKKGSVVYSTSDCLPDVLPSYFVRLLNRDIKWVSCSFHLVPHYSKRQGSKMRNIISYYAQQLSIFLMRFADLLIVDNSILKNELSQRGVSEKKIFISSMGIDKDYIDSIERGYYLYDGCFVGRLHPAKGIFDLANIWEKVVYKKRDARLAIIGEGDKNIVYEIKKKIGVLGLGDNVDLLGFLDNEDMFKILKRSKVFIFPSHEEGWGIAIAEAMACGLPAVIYDLPALREIFPAGVIRVRLGDINSFSDTVVSLLTDAERYNKLHLETQEIANRYRWDNVARREWEEICRIRDEKRHL